jgi:RND family efflux transporter MFP subunit
VTRTLAAAALLLLLADCRRQAPPAPPPPTPVGVVLPESRSVPRELLETGTLAALNSVDLVARVEGYLQQIAEPDGAAVRKGETLFVIEPLPYQSKLQQAQAAEAQQQALVKQADADYARQATLGRNNTVSQSQVDQSLANRDAARAQLQQAQTQTQQAAITYTYTRVNAPFDGVLTAHLVSEGALVGANGPTTLASVVQLDPIEVNFAVPEPDVLRIRAALAARGKTLRDLGSIPVEVGLAGESGYPHHGVLDYAAPMVDSGTGTLSVRARLDNADRALLPGYFARVRIPMPRDASVLLVPIAAVGTGQSGPFVLVAGKGDVVEQRPVRLGETHGTMQVIEHGLDPQDRVIVGGLAAVLPGDVVAPHPATAAAAPGSP